jgi:hypothetical protein
MVLHAIDGTGFPDVCDLHRDLYKLNEFCEATLFLHYGE